MCELFGLSAARPAAAVAELAEFRRRGGLTADNPDGWGIAWWQGDAFRLAKEPLPGRDSARFAELGGSVASSLVVAHVRKASWPPVSSADNTHPFQRICCGRSWVFAHNGNIPDMAALARADERPVCHPAGQTDSEHAFCHVLSHIAMRFSAIPLALAADGWPSLLAELSERIAAHGKFNFLMSDGDCLIAYGHDRLHHLEREDSAILVATEPLSDGPWQPFVPGELRVYRQGALAGRQLTHPPAAEPPPD